MDWIGRNAPRTSDPTMDKVSFELKLHFQKGSLTAHVDVPDRELRVADFLPILQRLQDAVTVGVVKDVAASGKQISCRAGCGACCRQPVPIAYSEAVYLAELVRSMPEERQAHVRARFETAIKELERHGLLETIRQYSAMDRDERMRVGMEYFKLGIACPFLENESCGIYEQRPLRCREFLVTSPPENCSSDRPGEIERPPSPPGPWSVIYRFEDGQGKLEPQWVPLVLALEFAAEREGTALPVYRGPDMFRNLVAELVPGDSDADGSGDAGE